MPLPIIAGLLIGDQLTYLELLCLRSFLENGHEYHLYTYGPVANIPDGVIQRDAHDIMALEKDLHAYTYEDVEFLADRFKYHLLQKEPVIWADLDMLCLHPWDFGDAPVLGWQRQGKQIGGAALRLPSDHPALANLIEAVEHPTPIPEWARDHHREEAEQAMIQGNPMQHADFKRGTFGVSALSYFLKTASDLRPILPESAFYPCSFKDRTILFEENDPFSAQLPETAYGVHLWGRRLRRSSLAGVTRLPMPSSFLGKLLERYGIEAADGEAGEIEESSGLVKQNVPFEDLSLLDLKRTMAALEQRTGDKFDTLPDTDKKPTADNVLVISAMKNEGPFILEWIAYHLSIGVHHFLVYTNDCNDGTVEILDRLGEMGYVTRLDNPFKKDKGQKPQRGALNDAVTQPVFEKADWVMCIDNDEFINIHVGDGTIPTLLKEMNYPNVISMTWRLFGNDSINAYEDRFISEQFTACAPEFLPKPRLGWGFKTMFALPSVYQKLGVHRPLMADETRVDEIRWVNGSGRMMPEMLLTNNGWRSTKRSIGYQMVTLNHYVLRSADSYLVKRDRGRINHVDQDQGVGYWVARNYIMDRDDSILPRLPRAKAIFDDLKSDPVLGQLHDAAVAWHRAKITELKNRPDYKLLYDKITGVAEINADELEPED